MIDFRYQIKSFFYFFYKRGVTFLSFMEYISECVFIKFNEFNLYYDEKGTGTINRKYF